VIGKTASLKGGGVRSQEAKDRAKQSTTRFGVMMSKSSANADQPTSGATPIPTTARPKILIGLIAICPGCRAHPVREDSMTRNVNVYDAPPLLESGPSLTRRLPRVVCITHYPPAISWAAIFGGSSWWSLVRSWLSLRERVSASDRETPIGVSTRRRAA